MAHALVAGDERRDAGGQDFGVVELGSVEQLDRVPGRVVEADQAGDLAVGQFVLAGVVDGDAGQFELAGDQVQVPGVGDLESGGAQPGCGCLGHREPVVEAVEPEARGLRVGGRGFLQPEEAAGELPPLVEVNDVQVQVTERVDRHRVPPG